MRTKENVIIRLNLEALNALFPEGSNARVELQNSVLTKAATQYVKGMLTDEVKKHLATTVKEIAAEVDAVELIASAFSKLNHWSPQLVVTAGSSAESAIAERVKNEFEVRIRDLIDAKVDNQVTTSIEGIDEKVEYLVNQKVRQITQAMMIDKVNAAFAAAGLQNIPQR